MHQASIKDSLFLQQRRVGVLLHPTSLPNEHFFTLRQAVPQMHGCLGKDAYDFVDWMAASGISVWQMLPTNPTLSDLSPYQSISAHAGNPELISIDWIINRGWASLPDECYSWEMSAENCLKLRKLCAEQFYQELNQNQNLKNSFDDFCKNQKYWLDDYAHFVAFHEHFLKVSWTQWPEDLRRADKKAITQYRKTLNADIAFYKFEQFAFYEQWKALKDYAHTKNILLFGDMPIFVAHDSADVWSSQHFFNLDEQGNPLTVAGVPPDYFSETGQHWGNPHYHWERMEEKNFSWWIARVKTQLQQFDLIRIDHFRGFEAYWEIPAESPDARTGQWKKAPGAALLRTLFKKFPKLPLIAENLGVITPEVEKLREEFRLPGMVVLQFAYDGNAKNPHLLQQHSLTDVVYTGTHDNDTSLGWFLSLSDDTKNCVRKNLFHSNDAMPKLLIAAALSSVGRLAVIPMQDFLGLDGEHRMNMPGTVGKNWRWRFSWQQVAQELAQELRNEFSFYDRLVTQHN